MSIKITVEEAIDMLLAGGVNLQDELSNVSASYSDIVEDIERDGGVADFDQYDYEIALREEVFEQDWKNGIIDGLDDDF